MNSIHRALVTGISILAGCGVADRHGAESSSRAGDALVGGAEADGGANVAGNVVQRVTRTDIVSNKPGAKAQDPALQNAWGLAFNPRGVAWVSANETGLSGVYDANGGHVIPSVTIPPPKNGSPPSHPTGQAFNSVKTSFKGDVFIFATEDGTISGWQGGTSATLRVDNSTSGAIYKGVTIAMHSSGKPRLYAANFHAGTVEVYDDLYGRVDATGAFQDAAIPSGFAPFNVQEVEGQVVVTYAKQDADAADDVAGVGNGFVDVFDPDGHLVSHLIEHGDLDSPWGVAVAPDGFGNVGGRLLVGNFGNGMVNVYTLKLSSVEVSATHEGLLGDEQGQPLVIDGLWALRFGPGTGGFNSTDLYFTAGPNDEADGVFGKLTAPGAQPPSPKTW